MDRDASVRVEYVAFHRVSVHGSVAEEGARYVDGALAVDEHSATCEQDIKLLLLQSGGQHVTNSSNIDICLEQSMCIYCTVT